LQHTKFQDPMKYKIVIQVILGIVAISLSYWIYEGIMKPERFKTEVSKRNDAIIEKLKDIRTIQVAYKGVYARYCSSFDTLAIFLEKGKLPLIKKEGNVPDTLTEAQALKMGLVKRDTVYVSAYESLFGSQGKKIDIQKLRYIPFSQNKEFEIKASSVNKGNIQVPVFEVLAPYDSYINDMDEQLVRNLNVKAKDMDRYPGIKLGSLNEPSTDGNWE
jgi:hypothetical protein